MTSLMATIFGCPRYTVNLSLRTGVPQPQPARRPLETPLLENSEDREKNGFLRFLPSQISGKRSCKRRLVWYAYGITAMTSFELALSLPLESTAVAT